MQLHQLRYVLAIAEHESFSKAADALFLAQPSLSVQIRKLEQELGARLFDRLGRKVVLTGAGEVFLAHARRALTHLEDASRCALDEASMRSGRVAVGALPSIAARLLPGLLARFQTRYPGVEVRLTEHNLSAEFERMVAEGDLDLAIVRTPRSRADLECRTLIREPLVGLVPGDHRLARKELIAPADLAPDGFVAMQPGCGLRGLFDTTCQRAGFEPRVCVETTQLATLWGMVARGVGVTLLPRLASSGVAGAGAVATLPLDDPEARRDLVVVWRGGSPLPPAPEAFMRALLNRAVQSEGVAATTAEA